MSTLAETYQPVHAANFLASMNDASLSDGSRVVVDDRTTRKTRRGYGTNYAPNDAFVISGTGAVALTVARAVNTQRWFARGRANVLNASAQELARLQDGWCGEGSVAPPEATLHTLLVLSRYFPQRIKQPEIEVDPDDGAATLRWEAAHGSVSLFVGASGRSQFVVTEMGDGNVQSQAHELGDGKFGIIQRLVASSEAVWSTLSRAE